MKLKQLLLIFFSYIAQLACLSKNQTCFEYSCQNCTGILYGECAKCKEEYKLLSGKCPCYDSNCVKCDSSVFGRCKECKKGYILANGTCACTVQECKLCRDDPTICNLCDSGYELLNNSCASTPAHCEDQNCEKCYHTEKGACWQCKDGYISSNGTCQAPPCLVQQDSNLCFKCPRGFKLINGKCVPFCNSQRCSKSKCENDCFTCINNTLHEKQGCYFPNYCADSNCDQCISKNKNGCIRCAVGYALLNGMCLQCNDPNCANCQYSTDRSCNSCVKGFHLSENNTCIATQNEFNCSDPMCLICRDGKKRSCIKCKGNLTLDDGKCESSTCKDTNCEKCHGHALDQCIQCKPPYSSVNGSCIKNLCNENCEICSNGTCSSCKKGYHQKHERCIPITCLDTNCELCDEKTCIKCKLGYQLNPESHICSSACEDENCYICSPENKTLCLTCKVDYVLTLTNKCRIRCFDRNCRSCSNKSQFQCTRCSHRTLLVNGECGIECSGNHCSICSAEGDRCLFCEGYYSVNEKGECDNSRLLILSISISGSLISGLIIFLCILRRQCKNKKRIWNKKQEENISYLKERKCIICGDCSKTILTASCGCSFCEVHWKEMASKDMTDSALKCPYCCISLVILTDHHEGEEGSKVNKGEGEVLKMDEKREEDGL